MTSVERFDEWCKSEEKDAYNNTLPIVIEKLKLAGHTESQIKQGIKEARYWLIQYEGSPRANKIHWGKFLMNWLRPGKLQKKSSRALPSRFDGEPKIIE